MDLVVVWRLLRYGQPETRRRLVAGGGEVWLLARRVGLRGGVTANTVDAARLSGSAGASAAVRTGLYVDGQVTRGSDRTIKGWGFALRVTY